MELLPRFALQSPLVSPSAPAEQLYRVDTALSRQVSPLAASLPEPGDRASGAGRLSGSQRLLPPLGNRAASSPPANGYSIEDGKSSYLDHAGLGWLIGRSTT
jgi:hypothetical protein